LLLAFEGTNYEPRELVLPPQVAPGAVTCLADGAILVHDLAAGRLLVLGGDLEVRTSVAMPGTVAALAPGPGGGFYATFPQTGEVRRYGANGEELATLPIPGLAPAPAWPVGLIVESNGEILVADRHGGRLVVIETSGRWAGSGSRRGWEPGLLRFPADIAQLPDGRIVVADQGNGRVQIFRRIEE
jgi:sugar lactone lactonase YvrE